MSQTDQFKKGMYLLIDNQINLVVDRQLKTQGRQGGLITLKLRNLETGQVKTETVQAGAKHEQVDLETKEVQFLYTDDSDAYFMETETFENISISLDVIGEYKSYLKEGDKNLVLVHEGRVISVKENPNVNLKVVEAPEAVKGDSATGATKIAVTETGLKVNVPLFIKVGDVINVSTETGEYKSKA